MIALAACGGGGSAEHPTQPSRERRECGQVADHLIGLMSAVQHVDPVALDPFRNAVAKACFGDHWGAEAKTCLLAAPTLSEGNNCQARLTDPQVAALQHALQVEFDKLKSGQ